MQSCRAKSGGDRAKSCRPCLEGARGKLARKRGRSAGKDRETEFQKLIEKEAPETRADLNKEKAQRGYTREVGEEVNALYKEPESPRSSRIDQEERRVAAMDMKFDGVRGAVSPRRKIRAEAENTMLAMPQGMCVNMQEDVQFERAERESSEAKVLQLLERVLEAVRNRVEGTVHRVQASTAKADDIRGSLLYGGGNAASEPPSPLCPESGGDSSKRRSTSRTRTSEAFASNGP